MAGIRINSIDALTLAVMAKTGEREWQCREIAQKAEVFFKKCGPTLKDNYYWRIDDLMALIETVSAETEE